MVTYIQFIRFSLVFIINLALTRLLLRNLNYYLMNRGIYGIDINKEEKIKIPEEGGISIVISLCISFVLIWVVFRSDWIWLLIFTSLLISTLGFIDHFRNIRPYPKFIYCAVIGSSYLFYILNDPAINPKTLIIAIIIIPIGYLSRIC